MGFYKTRMPDGNFFLDKDILLDLKEFDSIFKIFQFFSKKIDQELKPPKLNFYINILKILKDKLTFF